MIKNYLYSGFILIFLGIIVFIINLFSNPVIESLLLGIAGSCLFVGIFQIIKYFYWSKENNKDRFEKKMKLEKRELHDEFKEKLRLLSIRYTFLINLGILTLSIVFFSILGKLGYFTDYRIIIIYLGLLLLVQILISYIIYYHLLRKYI